MATNQTILLKKSGVVGAQAAAGDLQHGELAINYADGKIFYKDPSSGVKNFLDEDQVRAYIEGSDLDMGGNKVLFGNVYADEASLPDASTYHGMFAHVHGTGQAYYAHAGEWVQLARKDDPLDTFSDHLSETATAVEIAADLVPSADSAYDLGSATKKFKDLYLSGNTINLGTTEIQASPTGIKVTPEGASTPQAVITVPEGFNESELFNIINKSYVDSAVSTGDLDMQGNAVLFSNNFADFATLESTAPAASYPGLFAKVAGEAYWSDGTNWQRIAEVGDALSNFVNDLGLLDSTTVQGVIDEAYVQGHASETYIKGIIDSTYVNALANDFDPSAYALKTYVDTQVDSAISAILDGAPNALDTLNELAAALGDDSNFAGTITTLVGTKADKTAVDSDISDINTSIATKIATSDVISYINTHGDSIDLSLLNNDTADFKDSAGVQAVIENLVDSEYVFQRYHNIDGGVFDSTTTIAIIDEQFSLFNVAGGVDSDDVKAIIDAAYINSQIGGATSSQTLLQVSGGTASVSGSTLEGGTLTVQSGDLVFVNGALQTETDDYTITNGGATLTLASPPGSNFDVSVVSVGGSGGSVDLSGISQSIIPDTDITYDLGSATNRFRDLYLSGNTINLGDTKIKASGTGDVSFEDAAGAPRKIVVAELEVGTGAEKIKIQRGNSGQLNFKDVNDNVLARSDQDIVGLSNAVMTEAIAAASIGKAAAGENMIVSDRHILPDANDTLDLGSPSRQWRDVYIGPGSLYVNGQKVIEDNSGTITFSADRDQSMQVSTFGTGEYTVTSEAGINLTTALGTAADISITPDTGGQIELNGDIQIAGTATINSGNAQPITFGDAVSMNYNRITNVANPINDNDVANKTWVVGYVANNGGGGGGAGGLDSTAVEGILTSGNYVSQTQMTTYVQLQLDDYTPPSQDLSNYATTTAVNSAIELSLEDYSTTTEMNTAITTALGSYSTTTAVNTAIDQAISDLVDGAPTALDTLNELAVALSNDGDALAALTTTVDSKITSADATTLITNTVDAAFINGLGIESGTDSAAVVALIEANPTTDSAAVVQLISDNVQTGTDSAAVATLIEATVDAAYIAARSTASSSAAVDFKMYEFTTAAGVTEISGDDKDGQTLSYVPGQIQVFRNGVLILDGTDYTADDANTITLVSATALNDVITVTAFGTAVAVTVTDFEYTAVDGQTVFTGAATTGGTLSYTPGNILVHMNGILLTDGADYSATNGNSVSLVEPASAGDLVSIHAFEGESGSTPAWEEATSTVAATAGGMYIVDCSANPVTVNLPLAAEMGDTVRVVDGTGSAETNNITIARNGHNILGAVNDFTLDVNRAAVELVYYNAAQGWIVASNS